MDNTAPPRATGARPGSVRFLAPGVMLVSAVGIGYQLALMRVFAITQWHHFAYMVISVGLLGFGAGGTLLAMGERRMQGREAGLLRLASFLAGPALALCHEAALRVPFETFHLVSQPGQYRYLAAIYLILAIPFLLVSATLALAFRVDPGRVPRVYGANLAGSGLGAIGTVGLLYWLHPAVLPYALAGATGAAFLLFAADRPRALLRGGALLAVGAACVVWSGPAPLRPSEYKGMSYVLNFPGARIVAETWTPMSVITAVDAAEIRETPGQLSGYPMGELGEMPRQVGLFFDGGAVSPVNAFDGDLDRFAWLDYVVGAAAYRLVETPHVLVVGPGGGTAILGALTRGARHVTAVEADRGVIELMRNELRDFSGGLYFRPDVDVALGDGRGFLEHGDATYDLIDLGLIDSFNAAAAGVHALNESYLFTEEALALYLRRLSDEGVLSITRWTKRPPRDALKMFATAVEAAEAAGLTPAADHLAFIRTWNAATVIVSRAPLARERLGAFRAFCADRGFDLCHVPGLREDEVNRFNILERPWFHEFARSVLEADGREGREALYRQHLFHVRPATDNAPYFSRFFKWRSAPVLFRTMGSDWVPFVEWGYLALVATVIQAAIASLALIILPAPFCLRGPVARGNALWVLTCFLGLGLAYMALEIAFIQRFMLFLSYPVYAVGVVLTAFLLFAGCGSYWAGRTRTPRHRLVAVAVAAICGLAAVYWFALPTVFARASGLPDFGRVVLSIALLAPISFAMGIPFPLSLQCVNDRCPGLMPWAWAINGCGSVTGATAATLFAVHFGFGALLLAAMALYIMAAAAVVPVLARSDSGGAAAGAP